MFGYSAGAAPRVLANMIAERGFARSRWPFLTSLDLSAIHNEQQLITMVKDRTGETLAEAQDDVRPWMEGYRARVAAPEVRALGVSVTAGLHEPHVKPKVMSNEC